MYNLYSCKHSPDDTLYFVSKGDVTNRSAARFDPTRITFELAVRRNSELIDFILLSSTICDTNDILTQFPELTI